MCVCNVSDKHKINILIFFCCFYYDLVLISTNEKINYIILNLYQVSTSKTFLDKHASSFQNNHMKTFERCFHQNHLQHTILIPHRHTRKLKMNISKSYIDRYSANFAIRHVSRDNSVIAPNEFVCSFIHTHDSLIIN